MTIHWRGSDEGEDGAPCADAAPLEHADCPHVNRNDFRCATRFNLGRVEQAFSVCFGAFHGCPMYHRINAELSRAVIARQRHPAASIPLPFIAVTVHATCRHHPLRATGT